MPFSVVSPCHATGSYLALVQDDIARTIVLHVHLLEARQFSHRYAQKTVKHEC